MVDKIRFLAITPDPEAYDDTPPEVVMVPLHDIARITTYPEGSMVVMRTYEKWVTRTPIMDIAEHIGIVNSG